MAANHKCIHEEQIMGQSRAIERMDTELNHKKERLDELKEDNRRLEEKIDKLSENVNTFINASDTKDNELNNRVLRIETEQQVLKDLTKKNREDFNTRLAIITLIFLALTFYFNFLR